MSENQKKIWVTGASTGIGKAVAERFAKEGWKVAISARREELLKNIAQDNNIFDYPLDVTDKNKVHDVFKKILDFLHFLHIVSTLRQDISATTCPLAKHLGIFNTYSPRAVESKHSIAMKKSLELTKSSDQFAYFWKFRFWEL